jgi:hypothetical protein
MGKRKTSPRQVIPVLYKFTFGMSLKIKTPLRNNLWLPEATKWYRQASSWVKPILNEDYADDRKMKLLVSELNWEGGH